MYKETAKSEKNPIMYAILWIAFIYVFYVLWGITEILIEAKAPFYVKHIILFGLTTWFIWKIIKRFIVEYNYSLSSSEFVATRKLGRKEKSVFAIKYKNIEAIYNIEEKENIKNYKINKKLDISLTQQNGKQIYIVYKFNSKTNVVKLNASRKMIVLLKDYTKETEGENA